MHAFSPHHHITPIAAAGEVQEQDGRIVNEANRRMGDFTQNFRNFFGQGKEQGGEKKEGGGGFFGNIFGGKKEEASKK